MRELKSSGLEWIGKIPKDWTINRVKYIFDSGKGLSITKENLVDGGLPVISYGQIHSKTNNGVSIIPELLRFVDWKYSERFPQCYISQYDFVFADTSEDYDGCGNCAYKRDNSILFGGYHVVILHSKEKRDNRYLAYLFITDEWRKQIRTVVSGVKVFSITQKVIMNSSIILPSFEEQQKISDYLDAKCTEINALSADIQSEIETLEAYKRSVITEAVTKGLNPESEMKYSGIEWVGNIPFNWQIEKGKYCLKYLQKPTKPDDDVITCFRDGEVTLRKNRREEGFTISLQEIGYQGIDKGDLIVHGMDGFAGAIGISDSRGKASPVLNVLDTNHNKRYIMYYLRNMAYNGVFIALATGIRVRTCDTNWGKLRELPYILPPKEEQDRIVEYIDKKLFEVNSITDEKRKQLEILDEYKKSLIYEYVTGKKEVPAT